MSAKLKHQVAPLNEDAPFNQSISGSLDSKKGTKPFYKHYGWTVSWSKKVLKIYKALYMLEK